ncbi:DUF4112 domain-containing protein [Aestuariimicrobium soli]|uniref:DUF4112 domain-containing protein n=1 Tax=Aestuariimicrobium soli TaxID=2035834 RepID=UPI003EB8F8B6
MSDPRPANRPARSTILISKLLDDLVQIPGLKQGVGLDAIASIVPGFGSAAGTVASGAVIADSIRLRLPLPIIARMLLNLGIDALLGYIPYAGPFLDAFWRANRKNVRLLEKALVDEQRTARSSAVYLVTAITMTVVVILGLLALAAVTIWAILHWLASLG